MFGQQCLRWFPFTHSLIGSLLASFVLAWLWPRLLVAPPVSWGGERCAMPSERCFGQLPFGHGSSMEDEDFPFLNGMDIQLIWWPSCCQALRQKHETHWIGFLGKILTGNQRFSHDFPMKYWFFRLEFSFKPIQ